MAPTPNDPAVGPRAHVLLEANYRQLLDRRPNVAVLPWGATEAHNFHLPHGTDVIEARELAESAAGRAAAARVRVIIDLNAVPPAGVAGIKPTDKARPDGDALLYGALGVGVLKMKIHKAALARIFTDTAAFLDAEALLAIGDSLAG